jgi:hypothetical protein
MQEVGETAVARQSTSPMRLIQGAAEGGASGTLEGAT